MDIEKLKSDYDAIRDELENQDVPDLQLIEKINNSIVSLGEINRKRYSLTTRLNQIKKESMVFCCVCYSDESSQEIKTINEEWTDLMSNRSKVLLTVIKNGGVCNKNIEKELCLLKLEILKLEEVSNIIKEDNVRLEKLINVSVEVLEKIKKDIKRTKTNCHVYEFYITSGEMDKSALESMEKTHDKYEKSYARAYEKMQEQRKLKSKNLISIQNCKSEIKKKKKEQRKLNKLIKSINSTCENYCKYDILKKQSSRK